MDNKMCCMSTLIIKSQCVEKEIKKPTRNLKSIDRLNILHWRSQTPHLKQIEFEKCLLCILCLLCLCCQFWSLPICTSVIFRPWKRTYLMPTLTSLKFYSNSIKEQTNRWLKVDRPDPCRSNIPSLISAENSHKLWGRIL